MILTLDATPLLGRRTGIGRYVHQLLAELPAALRRRGEEPDVRVCTWTARGARVDALPAGVRQVGPRLPARVLRELWRRGPYPPVELLVGRTDVFHGTNFTSPPTRGAVEVVTVHDLTYVHHAVTVSPDSLVYQTLVPRALDRGARVLTPSRSVADAVREHYALSAERVTAAPLGVDPVWFTAVPSESGWLRRHGLPPDYLVFVGSLDPRKNLPLLLRAYADLRRRRTDVPALALAGPAGRERALGEQPGVHALGWLDDAELHGLVAGARALVLPSLDEGFGLPVLEALAAGRPVVASDLPVIREVAGPYASTAPADDAQAMADALERALNGSDDDAARSERRAWARRFSWAACADRTVEVYLQR